MFVVYFANNMMLCKAAGKWTLCAEYPNAFRFASKKRARSMAKLYATALPVGQQSFEIESAS